MSQTLVIDGHAIIHRAYHALPKLTNDSGTPTNAIYGFFSMFEGITRQLNPTSIIICYDTPTPTFRKTLLPEYQATRPPLDDDLRVQIPIIKELAHAAGLEQLEAPGYEADDIIGTIADQAPHHNTSTIILTGDRDILQLVNTNTSVIMPITGVSKTKRYTPQDVVEKTGVYPDQIPDLKALMGDASDNYRALKGVGPKTALKLLSAYTTIEGIYENISLVQPEKLKLQLTQHKEKVELLKTIATIKRDVPVSIRFTSFTGSLPGTFRDALATYKLRSLEKRFFPGDQMSLI